MWEVKFHKSFLLGACNTDFCVDEDSLSPGESEAFYNWVKDLLAGHSHSGRNKESWIDKNGGEIAGAASYKNNNGWHYHCGPTIYSTGTVDTPPTLDRNMLGDSTEEAVHYSKAFSGTIVILGYSRKHVPFLNDESQASAKQRHPFYVRLGSPRNSTTAPLPNAPSAPKDE